MDKLNYMNPLQLIRYFQKINELDFHLLLQEKDAILKMDMNKFNLLFLNVNNTYKKIILDDRELFEKVMMIPLNRTGKTIIDLSDPEIQEYIYNHPNLLDSLQGKRILALHLSKLNLESFSRILQNKNLNSIYAKDLLKEGLPKYQLTPYQVNLINTAIYSSQFKPIALLKIKNSYELFIYAKFHLLVEVQDINNQYLTIGGKKIKYEFIEKVNKKHILSLLEIASKTNENITNNHLFISILKLYMVLGFDNSKKILENFFTYSTTASQKRASDELFKDTRRQFRLKNQKKYYYYGMELDFEEALANNEVNFFKVLCGRDEKYVDDFLNSVKQLLSNLTGDVRKEKIKKIILNEINSREQFYHDLDVDKYQKYYQKLARTTPISINDIYQLFSDIDIDYQLTNDGKVIADKELTRFLLGNCKRDNDCLLRMVLNKQALGLNDELPKVINHFEEIKRAISNDKKLSLYSVLDIIDISKIFLYHLKPDELDITLATFSKILNSRKYCTESPEVILNRVMELHKERKKKISSAISPIRGKTKGAEYKVVDFDEESLLVSGIDSGSCFKVGGKGEDFFRFCLTNPLGLVFYIEYSNEKYVLPATINGNMLNINSIDPRIEEENLYWKLIEIITEIAKRVVQDKTNQIELVTITDIHHSKLMKDSNYETIKFNKFIPLNTDVYCDYNKSDVTNYILYKKEEKTIANYFDNKDLFYEERPSPYIFSPTREHDQERIEIILNYIAYSSINFLNIPEDMKNRQREFYNLIEVSDFLYIVGNKDWFIGIDKKKDIIQYCLPYDQRGIEEYKKYQHLIGDVLEHIEEYTTKKR